MRWFHNFFLDHSPRLYLAILRKREEFNDYWYISEIQGWGDLVYREIRYFDWRGACENFRYSFEGPIEPQGSAGDFKGWRKITDMELEPLTEKESHELFKVKWGETM